ncbi:MAG: hypothetical protein ACI867_001766 [Glaciecola sp.]|jgi:hypothetical protein
MASATLLTAIAFDIDTFEKDGLADPVIRVLGDLPANSQPFHLNRVYKGPQGVVEESVLLLEPDGRTVAWQRSHKKLELRGEMFEDLFRSQVPEKIEIRSHGEHTMIFLIDGAEAGRIPVFIDAPESVVSQGALAEAVDKGLSKSSIMWLSIPQSDGTIAHRPAWYVQRGNKVFVIKGGSEQELPNLEHVSAVDMTVKGKDVKAAIGVVSVTTRVVGNNTDEFETIAALGMGTRLNLPDGERALSRWRNECMLIELSLPN